MTCANRREAFRSLLLGFPLGDKLNVFISYSRDDLDFADQLDDALQIAETLRLPHLVCDGGPILASSLPMHDCIMASSRGWWQNGVLRKRYK
jgi:hypothetical protein